ncbi:tetratricopeptide repeat protein [Noviherbaspirillum cavernae]|nr:tetratricopeptide repeat protein [Noviherbaspirillum cavernae]
MKHQRSHTSSDIETALQHHRAGRLQQAEALYRKMPRNPDALHLRGVIAHQLRKHDEAIELIRQAIKFKPSNANYYFALEPVYRELNRVNDVISAYQELLSHSPGNALAQNNLGNAFKDCGRMQDAEACYQQAIAIDPRFAEAYANLGVLYTSRGDTDQAIACFQNAITLKPKFAGAHNDIGIALSNAGQLEHALASFQNAVTLDPGFFAAHHNLGCALRNQGRLDEAMASYKRALVLRPDFVDAHNDLGITHTLLGNLDEAIACYQTALGLNPNFEAAYNNLGTALHGKGKPDEAIAYYRQALARNPGFAPAHNALLLELQYSSSYSPEQMHAEHVRFGAQFETPLKSSWMPHGNVRDPQRRLRIGYVSPDFNRHAVSYFIEPVLALHDKAQVEVFCYYNGTRQDPVTQRLQALAEHWIPCRHLSDERLAARIRADGIDILIDLAGHTGGNRLLAFARKPAPVQATWLGYPATTGLSAIDYRLTDVHAEPAGMTEHLNTEQLWWLPEIFCCYRAHDDSPAVIDHPPALDNGFVTFGCFNNFAKVTDPVLALWARLLQRVPHARLMLEIHGIDEPARRAEVEQRLARLGIPSERQILVPRAPANQYALYNRIDIALDPFPCNGGTTSLDTLWMGVPLVTLAGGHFTARMGVTILTNAGLPELVAHSEDAYLDIAAALALDPARLARTRTGLRQRVQASPLMDAPRFTRHLEQAYRGMWHNWCESCENDTVPAEISVTAADAAALNNSGNALKEQGRLDEAATSYLQAITADPMRFEAHYNLGTVLLDQGKLDEAILSYQRALALNPDLAAAHHGIALAFADEGKLEEAIDHYRKAIALAPRFAIAYNNLGNALRLQGKLDEATHSYKAAIDIEPGFADAHNSLGAAYHIQGRIAEAVDSYLAALAQDPNCHGAYNNLGTAFYDQGLFDDAITCYRQSIALDPNDAGSHYNLGNAYAEQGNLNEAISSYLQAIALKLDYVQAYNSLGIAFALKGQFGEAVSCYETATALQPDFADAYNNLGNAFTEQNRIAEARECFQSALRIRPDFAEAHCNLGRTYHQQSEPDEAIACYRQALAYKPDYPDAYGNMLLDMQYSSSYSPEQMHAEHARFGAQFETPLKTAWMPHGNVRDPQRRLRIGYVSPDFNRHAVSYFIEPVLALHDKAQVEVFCYYNGTRQDPVTQRLQALAEHWIPCRHLSDERLAARIRADGIDVLIDLAGHTGGNRLLAFARKPAPVQATWLGYPATTGLSAIDYRLTDVHAEPAGMTEHLNTEQLWRLPEIFCCYRAHDDSPAVIDHPPALDNGFVTFGCFNNFAKVTDPVLALWARLLQRVPHARLMLEIHGIDEPARRAEVEQRLARLGIPSERQILVPRAPANQYALYNRIDIALDPFPCNGGTTSLDTLWMGVPLVTLAGGHFTARMGVTILTNAGLPELVAHSEDAYLEIAAALALDPARLARTRAGLRQRVQASPLMNAPRFTRHLEHAYRGMWLNWCNDKHNDDKHNDGKQNEGSNA